MTLFKTVLRVVIALPIAGPMLAFSELLPDRSKLRICLVSVAFWLMGLEDRKL